MKTNGGMHRDKGNLHRENAREERLQEIRRGAALAGLAAPVKNGDSIPQASPETGYYGRPILKGP